MNRFFHSIVSNGIDITLDNLVWFLTLCILFTAGCNKRGVIEVDVAKPEVTIMELIDGQILKGPISIEVKVRHVVKINSVSLYLDGMEIGKDTIVPYQYRWNAGYWADGQTHELMAKAIDSLGNTGVSKTVAVTVDTAAIGIQLSIIPADEDLFRSRLLMIDTTDGNNINAVTFFVDGQVIGIDSVKPFQQIWNVGFWADGNFHSVQAVAVDSGGRGAKSSIIQILGHSGFIVWPEPISPINNEYIESQPVQLIWKPVPTAVMYEIEIREFPNSATPVFTTTIKDTFVEMSTLPSSLFCWKVKAYNGLDRSTSWSPGEEFATIVTFSKLYQTPDDGGIQSAQQISSGDFIVTARMVSDGIILKLDKFGDIIWQKNNPYAARAAKETKDYGFILAGSTSSSVAKLVKLNNDGNEVFSKSYSGYRAQYFNDVVENDDGSFFVGGSVEPDLLSRNGWLLKFSSTGDTIFTRTITGDGQNDIHSLKPFGDDILLAGTFTHMIDSGYYGSTVSWLRMMSKTGNTLWSSQFQHSGATSTYVQCITVNPNGDVILAGSTEYSDSQSADIWLAKANPTGVLVWSKTYGGTDADFARSIDAVKEGGYIITGGYETSQWSNHDLYAMRIDENGNQLWFKRYAMEGPDNGWAVCQTLDGGFLVGGESTVVNDGYKMRLIKTDKYGRVKFAD